MAGLVPAIDVMTARYWYVFLLIPGAHAGTPAAVVPRPGRCRPDMLSRPPLRFKRGRTMSKTVERCLLAKRPDWQPVLTLAGPSVRKRCSMSWSDKPRQRLLWKTAEGARQYGSWPQPRLPKQEL